MIGRRGDDDEEAEKVFHLRGAKLYGLTLT
jgi:hypothetical protein